MAIHKEKLVGHSDDRVSIKDNILTLKIDLSTDEKILLEQTNYIIKYLKRKNTSQKNFYYISKLCQEVSSLEERITCKNIHKYRKEGDLSRSIGIWLWDETYNIETGKNENRSKAIDKMYEIYGEKLEDNDVKYDYIYFNSLINITNKSIESGKILPLTK